MPKTPDSPDLFQRLLDVLHDGIVVLDGEDIIELNSAFAEIVGYTKEALLDSRFEDLIDPLSRRTDRKTLDSLYAGKSLARFTTRLRSKDGDVVHADMRPVAVQYQGSDAVLLTVRDITREVSLETAVTQLENRFASLYDMSPVAYFTLNRNGTVEQVNQEAESLLGYDASEVIGKTLSDFLAQRPQTYDPADQVLKEVLRGKEVSGIEVQLKRKDGRLIWVSLSSRALTYSGEKPSEIGLTAFDVTRRRAAEARVREEKDRADLYLGIMTSDLNRVNQSSLYSLELLSGTADLSEEHRRILQETSWNIRRAARMIANMRTLIYLRDSPPPQKQTNLYPHFERGRREASRDFAQKTLTIKTNIRDGAFMVRGHAFLWSVFFNILHNALMYDTDEEVAVEVKASFADKRKKVRIEFIDHGPGIPDAMKERVFRRSGSGDKTIESGLGLTVVSTIVSALGGRVWVEDRVAGRSSEGCKFVVELLAWMDEMEAVTEEAVIDFYKSEDCVFCGPTLEALYLLLDEMSLSHTIVRIIDVDDPASGVPVDELPALPTIRIRNTELAGYVSEDDLRTVVMGALLGLVGTQDT
ncbi:MAG: PAS domain S-box protein [Candidatus Thorarchaeota archaeon]|nr:PAS domain S-box protein [Candidatus Thorarchaeota archaeon]